MLGFSNMACSKALHLPDVNMNAAIETAQQYVRDQQIDVSQHYLASAQWINARDENRKPIWKIEWRLRTYMTTGGQIFVYVDQEGQATHAFGE
jgi:hypothetical protein